MARRNKEFMEERTKQLLRAKALLNVLTNHAKGLHHMTPSQVNAAKIVIAKTIPDLKSVQVTGLDGAPLDLSVNVRFVDK